MDEDNLVTMRINIAQNTIDLGENPPLTENLPFIQ